MAREAGGRGGEPLVADQRRDRTVVGLQRIDELGLAGGRLGR